MRIGAVSIAAVLVFGPAAAATSSSGLRGLVTIGPLRPLCSDTSPCDAPAAGVTLSFSHDGVVVRHVTTGADGRYRVLLPPARAYGVRANRGMRLTPSRVWVRPGIVATLRFAIDTGIR